MAITYCKCGKILGYVIDGTQNDGVITPGCCQSCADAEKKELKTLESLPEYTGRLQWGGWVSG